MISPDTDITPQLESSLPVPLEMQVLDIQKDGYNENDVTNLLDGLLPVIGSKGKKELRELTKRLSDFEADNKQHKKIISPELKALIGRVYEAIVGREFAIDDERSKEVSDLKLKRELDELREDMQLEAARQRLDQIPDSVTDQMLNINDKTPEISALKKKPGVWNRFFGGQQ